MASVDFKKCKAGTGDAGAILRHCDAQERLKHEHSNPHIDPALTPGNIQARGYKMVMQGLHDRLAELDAQPGANRRRDRVELFMLEVPVPAGHDPKTFMEMVLDEVAQMYGARNVLGWYLHVDEVHEYIDHGEVKRSLPHIHIPVVPEIDGRLNGKSFSSRARMMELNRRIDRRAREMGGPAFLTGKTPRKRSVEELKAQSYKDARTEEARARREALRAARRAQSAAKLAEQLQTERDALQEEIGDLKAEREALRASLRHDESLDERIAGVRARGRLEALERHFPDELGDLERRLRQERRERGSGRGRPM